MIDVLKVKYNRNKNYCFISKIYGKLILKLKKKVFIF